MQMKTTTFRLNRGIRMANQRIPGGTPISITHPARISAMHALQVIRNGHADPGASDRRLSFRADQPDEVEPESAPKATAAAAAIAARHNIDLAQLTGSGADGQITKGDVEAAIAADPADPENGGVSESAP